jgi:hypothetical protein
VVARLLSRNDRQPGLLAADKHSCADCASVHAFEHLSQGPFGRLSRLFIVWISAKPKCQCHIRTIVSASRFSRCAHDRAHRHRLVETWLCVDSDTQAAPSCVFAMPILFASDTNCLCPSQPERLYWINSNARAACTESRPSSAVVGISPQSNDRGVR